MLYKMYSELEEINQRPAPYACYTARDLWTDEHTAEQMLRFHLDARVDLSSRNAAFIHRSVEWIVSHFSIGDHTQIADFGCGPGLYTTPLAQMGANVTGIDFSKRSILHARNTASELGLFVNYEPHDYLSFETDDRYDLIMMIMCDFCALSPEQRSHMLRKFHRFLKPDGALLFDVYSLIAFDQRQEEARYEHNLLDGFWSPCGYYGFLNTFKYNDEKVILDKYTIVETNRKRVIFNWLQYFTIDSLERELTANDFAITELFSDVAGSPFQAEKTEFAVVVGKR